jgi:phosphonate transport system substrate-binding protein
MKKLLTILVAVLMIFGLAACNNGGNSGNEGSNEGGETAATSIEKLTVMYVPSRPAEDIITATSGLGDIIIKEMSKKGFEIGAVEIAISEDYNACGEALSAGTADVGYVPGGTYVLYSDEINLLVTATRDNLVPDATDPNEWNVNPTTREEGVPVTYYKGLIYAAPTEKGKAVAAKVAAGEELTWEELDACTWVVGSVTSGAQYIYPNLWLKENYDKTLNDLSNKVNLKYPEAFQQAAAEQVDIITCYADGRMDYEGQWNGEWGRDDTIWNQLPVIGVTQNIYNDTVCLAKTGPNAEVLTNPEFMSAFADVLMNLKNSEEGKTAIGIYSHTGYVLGNDKDYDVTRNALAAME